MNEIGMRITKQHNAKAFREARTADRGFKVRTVIQCVRFYSLVSREHLVMKLDMHIFSRALHSPEYPGALQILEIGFYTMKTRFSWAIVGERQ